MADDKKPLDLSEFGGAKPLDLTEFQSEPTQPAASSGALRRVADTGLALAKGVMVGVPETAVGLADLVTGGKAGKAVQAAGRDFKADREFLTSLQSPEQHAADAEVQAAKGFLPTVGAMVQNPSTIANALAESAPSMVVGGLAGRGLMAAKLARSPIAAGAAGEGVVTAGQNAEQVRQETADGLLTPGQSAVMAASGMATGAISAGAGRVAKRLGLGDIDTAIAAGKLAPSSGKGLLRRVAGGAVSEGVLEELPQSMQEQAAQNVALGRPIMEGVPEAGAAGMLVGGLTGAGVNVLQGAPERTTTTPPPAPQPVAPPPAAVAPTTPTTPVAPPVAGPNVAVSTTPPPQSETTGGFSGGFQAPPTPPAAPAPTPPQAPNSASAAMGLRRTAGPISSAAATAVDTGATLIEQHRQIKTEADDEASKAKTAGKTGSAAPSKPAEPAQQATARPAAPVTGPITAALSSATQGAPANAQGTQAQQGQAASAGGAPTDAGAAPGTGQPAASGTPSLPAAVPGAAAGAGQPSSASTLTPKEPSNAQGREIQSIDPDTGEITFTPANTGRAQAPADAQGDGAGATAQAQPEVPAGQPARLGEPAAAPPVQPAPQGPADSVDAAAHATAATSPHNDLPEPTQAQKEAGNYPKGHVKLGGLDLSIENPEGSVRKSKPGAPVKWETTMKHHYGYIKGTLDQHGEQVDAFIKPGTPLDYSGRVYVIDQIDPATGKFDEHKVMIGFDNALQARQAYQANYHKGWKGAKAVTPMEWADFKTWVKDGPKNTELAKAKTETAAKAEPKLPAVPQRLFVQRGNQRFEVASLEDAASKWNAFRDKTGAGVSEIGNGAEIVDQDGKEIARISYNGRVWPPGEWTPDMKPLLEGDSEPSAPAARPPEIDPQEQYQAVIDDLPDAQIEALFKKAKLISKNAPVEKKRAMLRNQPEAKIFPLYEQMVDNGELPDESSSDRFDEEDDWDISVANFPEPKKSVDATKIAGPFISAEEAAARLAQWKAAAKLIGKTEDHSNEVIISLFDASGEISKPWRDAGYDVRQYDIKLGDDLLEFFPMADIMQIKADGKTVAGVLAQPPCTTFTSTGARWHKTHHDKHDRDLVNKMFGHKAATYFSKPHEYTKALVSMVDLLIGETNPGFFLLENPNGGAGKTRIEKSTGLPKPTLTFNPNNYGDPYTKKTLLWGNFNPNLPTANVEPTQGSLMHKLWSRAEKGDGKRSLTPEGFAYAFFMANHKADSATTTSTEDQAKTAAAKSVDKTRGARRAAWEKNPFMTLLGRHGLYHVKGDRKSLKTEFSPDQAIMVPGYPPVFRYNGLHVDQLLVYAIQDGFLLPGSDERDLSRLIERAIRGERIAPLYAEGGDQAEFERERAQRGLDDMEEGEAALGDAPTPVVDGFAESLDDVPDVWGQSNVSTVEAMRALGFSEQEIEDEIALEQGRSRQGNQGDQGAGQAAPGDQAEAGAQGTDEAPDAGAPGEGLTAPTPEEVVAKQEREAQALADEKAQKQAEQERLRKEAEDKEAKARADATVDDFELGKTADQQLSGMDDMFSQPAASQAPEPTKPAEPTAPAEPPEAVPAPKAAAPTSILQAFKDTVSALYDGKASLEDYRAAYARVRDAEAVKAELGKMTKDQLAQTFGIMRDGKKDEFVDMAYQSMLRQFALGKEYGPRTYFLGAQKAYDKQKAEALDALVAGQTDDDLKAYAEQVAARRAENDERRAAVAKAIEDPKTIPEFRAFLEHHIRQGKTNQEARMLLTQQQRALMDDLQATETRSRRKDRTEAERTQVKVAGQTVDGEIIATKHTKKGHDLFVVRLSERVSREDYETLNAGAKRIGGYYSSFRGGGAIPGFQFTTREQAQAFVKLAQGDNAAAVEASKERRDAYQDDRSQSAAERLTEMADKMDEAADESLALERKANTARRARFAAAAETQARAAKAMAKTMRNVAAALTDGKAKFLDRIRTRTQVELLQTYVASAKDAQLRAKYQSYAEQEKRKGQPPDQETADYAEFPVYRAYRSDLASLARQMLEIDGTKKLGQQLMKVADDMSDAFTAFAKEPGNLFRLSAFSVGAGDAQRTAIFKDRETAERSIKRSGLVGKAIVFPEKRGVNRIIMSPSEAIARGVWKGDGDKQITLTAEFGAELVEALGRANRRKEKVSVPWQFERAYERRKQLSKMGLETPFEFRAALREFIGLREQAAEADRIKELERAMIGKAKDGLDFFPTPEAVADEMIAAADIAPDMSVLEPSAGMGHIADRVRAAGAEPDVIELANDRRELLQEKGYHALTVRDFLELKPREFFTYGDVFRAPDGVEGIMHGGRGWSGRASLHEILPDGTEGKMLGWYDRDELVGVRHRGSDSGYDRIVMNPPFSDGRDIQHVRHAYDLLKPGGRLVALMGESAFTNQNKRATEFREWLVSVGGSEEKLPEGSFMDPSLPVNTGANARMVVIEKAKDVAGEPSARYDAREPDAPYDQDLFGNPLPAPAGGAAKAKPAGTGLRGDVQSKPDLRDTPAPPGDYFVNTFVSTETKRDLGAAKITKPEHAAQATAYLYKSAVERFDGIVTDKDGKVLAVVGGFKGALAGTSVYPSTLVAEAVRIPGAAHIWFSHNHPSGSHILSRADERLTETLSFVFKGSGIEPMGTLAVTGDKFSFKSSDLYRGIESGTIPKTVVRKSVPVYERELSPGIEGRVAVSDPSAAKDVAAVFYAKSKVPGILLLDSQHRIAAWVPVTQDMMQPLRNGSGLNTIYRAISQANAGAGVIVHGGELDALVPGYSTRTLAINIGSALSQIDVRPLDVINVKTNQSAAAMGLDDFRGGAFARGGDPFYSALEREISGINAKAQPAMGWLAAINGLVKAGKVKADEVEWSGLTDWLRMQQGKVTREQVLQYLATNGVQVTETTLGGDAQAEADFQEARDAVLRELEDLGYEPLWINEGTTLRGVLQVRSGREFDVTDSWEDADAEDAMQRLDDILQTRDENLYVVNDERALPKYKLYQLPGGTNYREVLLTLPGQKIPEPEMMYRTGDDIRAKAAAFIDGGFSAEAVEAAAAFTDAGGSVGQGLAMQDRLIAQGFGYTQAQRDAGQVLRGLLSGQQKRIDAAKAEDAKQNYKSPHWDQPNVLAHLRLNDRTDADGKRVLFVEEIQSDWAQAGKREGFAGSAVRFKVGQGRDGSWFAEDEGGGGEGGFKTKEAAQAWADEANGREGLPRAPFVTKTDAWVSLALKRVIKMAVDEGYDRVAFVTGEQSAERFSLDKQIGSVTYVPGINGGTLLATDKGDNSYVIKETNVTPEKVADYVGKDVAEKLLAQPSEKGSHTLRGAGLVVPQVGMRAFYDKIVPNTLKDVLRKVGGGQIAQIPMVKPTKAFPEGAQQPGFDITPTMRERAADGLPLFDRQQDQRAYRLLQALQRNPMDAQRVRDIVGPIAQKWDVEVRVVDTPADLPVKAPSDARGMHWNGVIYVVARTNRTEADVRRTLAHEAIAHYGLRAMLGREGYRKFVSQVQFAARQKDGPLREISDYVRRTYVDENGKFNLSPGQEGDEIAARAVELGVDPLTGEFKPGFGMLKAMFAKVMEFLRSLGLNITMSNAELQGILVRSMRNLGANSAPAMVGEAASAARRPPLYFDAKESPLYERRTAEAVGVISQEQADKALQSDATSRRILAKGNVIKDGQPVGVRLNINVLKSTGVPVTSIHAGGKGEGYKQNRGWWGNEVLTYAPVVTLRDAYFNVSQRAREQIASGQAAKSPMASVDGNFVATEQHNFDGVEFRFNPKREHLFVDKLGRVLRSADEITVYGNHVYARGKIEYYGPEDVPARAGDAPTAGRLFEEGGTDKPLFARAGTAQGLSDVTDTLRNLVDPIGKVSLWQKTVGTQFHKATKDKDFKRVFDAYLQQTDDTAHYAIEAERNAPDILMRLDSVVDAAKALWHSGPKHKRDLEAVSKALFANIEGKEGVQSVRFDDDTLRIAYNLTPKQIDMYHQARAAVDTSIDRLAQTYAAQVAQAQGMDINEVKNMALDDTVAIAKDYIQTTHDELRAQEALRKQLEEEGDLEWEMAQAEGKTKYPPAPSKQDTQDLLDSLDAIEEKAKFLKDAGYMPALRFGEYAVTVTNDEGETLHFEMFESKVAANLGAMRLRKEYPGASVEKSVLNPEQYAMFKGVSPETVELFAAFTGADKTEAYQQYIAMARSARSTKMRELKRKGIAGFSEDATRVLASFLTSNARQSAINMNQQEIAQAMGSKELARKGDVQREAQKLHEYMANPREEAQAIRGFMFFHMIGGSLASALVNLTQPIMQTSPYLAQFAGAKTPGFMASAAKMAATGKIADADLRSAAEQAAADGITEPHEIHQLMADAGGSAFGDSLMGRAAVKLWGSIFASAESFNRRITFLAAYQVAKDNGMPDPYGFARKAVYETQGIYNKVNRPNWGRGAVGATLFTFKQFSISYIEWLTRLPRKQQLLALGLLVLAAGADGLPFADDIEDVIDTIGQSLGYNTNSKKAMREMLVNNLGETAGTILNTGLLSMSGVDVSGRLGMGNLLPGTAMFKPSEKDKSRTLSEFAGPLGGLLQQAQQSVAKVQAGDLFGRTGAAAALLPKALRDFMQGSEMADTGVYRDARGYKVADVTAGEGYLKMLGLQPSSIASRMRKLSDVMQDRDLVTTIEAEIADRWASGLVEKDADKVAKARQTLIEWNRNNPETPIRINPMQIARRARQMNMDRQARILKTMPKELRAQAAKDLQ